MVESCPDQEHDDYLKDVLRILDPHLLCLLLTESCMMGAYLTFNANVSYFAQALRSHAGLTTNAGRSYPRGDVARGTWRGGGDPQTTRRQGRAGAACFSTAAKTLQEKFLGAAESCERAAKADRNEWIYLVPKEQVLAEAKTLETRASSMTEEERQRELPLLGSTFAVKDNLMVKGLPTTNAMDYRAPRRPPLAHESAAVVQKLQDAGAIVVGKTNLDCAATGLVGVRSPYGACQNALDRSFLSGGSSSGSGVAVALGQVTFSLGTDTAGSGRVPAALNNIVGLKASRGLLSTHGLLPACKSLDCVSIFSLTVQEARYLHFLEIGTSNFRTLVGHQPPEQSGMSVEALPYYVEELRQRYNESHPRVTLVNAALLPEATNYRATAWFVHPENLSTYGLPAHMAGTTRIGPEPHWGVLEHLKKLGLAHLLVSRQVPALTLGKLLDLHQACRLGFLKIDAEGMDELLLRAYVKYLWEHPPCWADGIEFEVNHFLKSSKTIDVWTALERLGYRMISIRDPLEAGVARMVHEPPTDARHLARPLPDMIPPAPQILHMLLPCFFSDPFACEATEVDLEQTLHRWRATLPGWRLRVWSPSRLVEALASLPDEWPMILTADVGGNEAVPVFAAKYQLLAYFGGVFVPWSLEPPRWLSAVLSSTAWSSFQIWDTGINFRVKHGLLIMGAAFHPVLQSLAHSIFWEAGYRHDAFGNWRPLRAAQTLGIDLPRTEGFGIPSQPFLDFHSFGAASQARAALYSEAWERSVDALKAIGGTCVEVDYAPFQEAANLLYQGPWVAERLSSVADWASDPEVVHPIVRKIAEHGTEWSAQQCFEAIYRLQQLRIEAQEAMSSTQAEVLVTPTVGATYTIEDVLADPVALNTQLGRYTNHMNLLDLCGIAVPTVLSSDAPCLPFGVTISAAAGHDAFICDIAQRLHAASKLTVGALQSSVQDVSAAVEATQGKHFGALPADVETFEVAVCGAHMEGLPLSWQLTERGGRFVRRARTAPRYRLVAFDMKPPRPGLVDSSSGASIELEIWELPAAAFGSFMKLVASPLGIGWIELEDGSRVQGFRQVDVGANSTGLVNAGGDPPSDITSYGSWRNFLKK
ncbi:Allophanate hydrolase [Durusdinium trenchii]|uniref:Allophanate hydrolase n=1 Tax=Durusdinium trenchii TaxID=1381693 RepID=A0ABP0MWL5_9DINO